LFEEQPKRNLWRRPIPGMLELVDELVAGDFPVGVVSNAEGGLADLIAELGWTRRFVCVADSGRIGVEKPARGIFAWAAEHLGVPIEAVVHVGDSRAADVEGALAAGQRAVWFGPAAGEIPGSDERVGRARDAVELRKLLHAWGLPVTQVVEDLG
jgi:putative hydrolase of the HAD superfamily